MNRLTEHHVNKAMGAYMACSMACIADDFDCSSCQKLCEMVDRLSAYEDSGLEPEEIVARLDTFNPPLTLEELREMDGEPVWVEFPKCPEASGWMLVSANRYLGECDFENCGKTWLAYRRKPEA